ncbi:MAG: zf-HC2 domain-containing protein [Vicinamibacteria bacterium]
MREDIIALLYDDGELGERSRARDHLAQCVPCRLEYSELKGVRKVLGGWDVPIAVVPSVVPISRFGVSWLPAGLAAAAGLVLGIGLAVAGRNTLMPASTQTAAAISPAPANSTASPTNTRFVSYDVLQDALKTQEAHHQAEIDDLRRSFFQAADASAPTGNAAKMVSNPSPAVIEKLLRASEDRQARLFEARLSGLRTESDLQRQYDMAQIAAGLAYIDSRTGADAARTSELMKNLVRVTAKPQDR